MILIAVLAFSLRAQAAGVKTINGGDWNVASNWIGGVLPSNDDDVIVNGNVIKVYSMSVRNLVINSGASIKAYKPPPSGAQWNIGGNLTNNGIIAWGDTVPMSFSIRIYGSTIRNDGSITASELSVRGLDSHTVAIGNGAGYYFNCPINASAGFFNGTIQLDNNFHFLKSSSFAPDIKIKTFGHSITCLPGGSINGGIVEGNTQLYDVMSEGTLFLNDVELYGTSFFNNVTFKGTVFNAGDVGGVNQGVRLYKDLYNSGNWNPVVTTVHDSLTIHHTGTTFGGTLITASPNVSLAKGVVLEGVFDCPSIVLYSWRTYLNGSTFKNSIIEGANIYDGVLENCTITRNQSFGATSFFHGNTVFQGKTVVRFNIEVNGSLTNKDSLLNDGLFGTGSGHNITVNGTFKNEGTIYNVTLNLFGDINNTGTWTNFTTTLHGSQPRSMSLGTGKEFRGVFTDNSIKEVTVLSDLLFSGSVSLHADTKWYLSGQTLSTAGSGEITGGTFSGNVTLDKYKGSSNKFEHGVVTINGKSEVPDAKFYSSVVNNDTILGLASYVYLYKNVTNNGYWNPPTTVVADSLTITTIPGSYFGGELLGTNGQTTGFIMNGEFDFDYFNFDGTHAYLNGSKLKNALQISKANLHGAVIENSLIRSTFGLYDSTIFQGTVKTRHNLPVFGILTNKDSLIADLAEGNTQILLDGHMINHGTIVGVPLTISGNIINHGNWTEKTTTMSGTAPRKIFLEDGKVFEGDFSRTGTDTAGTLHALSDLRFGSGKSLNLGNTTVNMDHHSLTVPGTFTGNINGPVRFIGKTYASTITIHDSVIVEDSLFLTHGSKIYGPVLNEGLFEGNATVSFYNNIENKGTWSIPNNYWYVNKLEKRVLRLWNTWPNPIVISKPVLSGGNPAAFQIVEGDDSTILQQSQFKQIAVRYIDTTKDVQQTLCNIPSTGIGTLSTIYLYGDTAGSVQIPLATFNRDSIAFGQVKIDSTHVQHLIIQNVRMNLLTIDTAYSKGDKFKVTVVKNSSQDHDSALVRVTLTPKNFGSYNDTLFVSTNVLPFMHKFALSAVAPQPNLASQFLQINFNSVTIDSSKTVSLKLTNSSINTAMVDSVRIKSKYFKVNGLVSGSMITKNDTVVALIVFTPDSSKTFTDTLMIFSNSATPVLKIALAGSGSKPTSIAELMNEIPTVFALYQNYPNPFNPTTTIKFGLPEAVNVTLKIYDALGREVATLVNNQLTAGYYSYEWNAGHLASGVYIYRMTAVSSNDKAKPFNEVKKLLLMK